MEENQKWKREILVLILLARFPTPPTMQSLLCKNNSYVTFMILREYTTDFQSRKNTSER